MASTEEQERIEAARQAVELIRVHFVPAIEVAEREARVAARRLREILDLLNTPLEVPRGEDA